MICIGAALFSFASNMRLIWVAMLCMGFGIGFTDAACNLLVMKVWHGEPSRAQTALALNCSAFTAGAFLSPMVAALSLTWTKGIELAWQVMSALCVPIAVSTCALPSPDNAPSETEDQKTKQHANDGGWRGTFMLACIGMMMGAGTGAEHSMGTWLGAYGVEQIKCSEAAAAMLSTAYWTSLTVGRLLYTATSSTSCMPSNKRLVLCCNLMGIVCSAGLYSTNHVVNIACCIGLGLAVSVIFMCGLLIVAECGLQLTPNKMTFMLFCTASGEMLLPYIVGLFFEKKQIWLFTVLMTMAFTVGLLMVLTVSVVSSSQPKAARTLDADQLPEHPEKHIGHAEWQNGHDLPRNHAINSEQLAQAKNHYVG